MLWRKRALVQGVVILGDVVVIKGLSVLGLKSWDLKRVAYSQSILGISIIRGNSKGKVLSLWAKQSVVDICTLSFPPGAGGGGLVTESRLTLLQPHGLLPTRLLCPWDFPGKTTGVGCHSLLQAIFPTQGSRQSAGRLLCCRWILYWLSYRRIVQTSALGRTIQVQRNPSL